MEDPDFMIIPELLHDAQLTTFVWDEGVSEMCLGFYCLRRNVDNTEIENREVLLNLSHVKRVCAYYNPADIEQPFSEIEFTGIRNEDGSFEDLIVSSEVDVSLNSKHQLMDMHLSAKREWLFGDSSLDLGTSRYFLQIHFRPERYSAGYHFTDFYIEFDSLLIRSGNRELSISDWEQQYEAWWLHWSEHWEAKEGSEDGFESIEEDSFVPAPMRENIDFSYVPPDKPAFHILPTDAPEGILQPVRDYVEALQARNWTLLAKVYPNFDLEYDEHAKSLEERFLGDEFGRWLYVREVVKWWIEGSQACLTVCGVEHAIADGEDPHNLEMLVAFALRKIEDNWVIWNYALSWPGSRLENGGEVGPSWRDEWKLE